jgi:hypothetical protein
MSTSALLAVPQDVHSEILQRIPSFDSLLAFILTHSSILLSYKLNSRVILKAVAHNQFGEHLALMCRLIKPEGTDDEEDILTKDIQHLVEIHSIAVEMEKLFVMFEKPKR